MMGWLTLKALDAVIPGNEKVGDRRLDARPGRGGRAAPRRTF